MSSRRSTLAIAGPLIVGVALLAIAIAKTDLGAVADLIGRFGDMLPIALVPGAVWHLLRTAAWHQSFPAGPRPRFWRAFRLRLAAEAVSYATVSGLAGDPLKVVLLHPAVPAAIGASAVALERLLYLGCTFLIVGAAAAWAAVALPLSPAWRSIYWAMSTIPLVLLAAAVLLVRQRRWGSTAARRDEEAQQTHSKIRRFVRDVYAHLRETARSEPRRIVRIAVLELAAYVAMVCEVWLALRLMRVPIAWTGALAVETFTRVTSTVTIFIPANLGALEASNVAGAAALHLAAGGLVLALVRRVRGLLWCAAGFIVYPGRRQPGAETDRQSDDAHHETTADRQPLAIVVDDDGEVAPSDVLGGLPIAERVARAAARAGYDRLLIWSPRRADAWRLATRRGGSRIAIDVESDLNRWRLHVATLPADEAVTVVASSIVASPAVLATARAIHVAGGEMMRPVPAAEQIAGGVLRLLPPQLAPAASLAAVLRAPAAVPPLTLSVATRDDLEVSERALRESIFKPTDGILASLNRRLSIPISVALIRLVRMNANAMSALIIALGLWAGWLFAAGDYTSGVLAALVSLAASVLDGCDGELARLQYTESALGCWIDTIGDYTYYAAIFAGLTVGSVRATGWDGFWWIGAALAAGLLLTFSLLIVLRRRITAGRPEQLNTNVKAHFYATGKRWAWLVAKLSNCATRAMMPYGIVAFAAADLLPALLALAALGANVYWISLAVELRGLLAHWRSGGTESSAASDSPVATCGSMPRLT